MPPILIIGNGYYLEKGAMTKELEPNSESYRDSSFVQWLLAELLVMNFTLKIFNNVSKIHMHFCFRNFTDCR